MEIISEDREALLESCRCCLEGRDNDQLFPIGAIYDGGTVIDLVKTVTNMEVSFPLFIFKIPILTLQNSIRL
jgi:hypothetical protein